VITLTELLWALIGLLLMIVSSFLGVHVLPFPWQWETVGTAAYSLGINYQVGAVFLVSCLGGQNAAVISQIAYLGLGLFGLPIFDQGGGLSYLQQPTFGYLLGFLPGAWVCGYMAGKLAYRLELIALSCLSGLVLVHVTGVIYLVMGHLLRLGPKLTQLSLSSAVMQYSVHPFGSQIIVICAVSVLAYGLRRFLFL
jgi:biotin transport system substrate-specific component